MSGMILKGTWSCYVIFSKADRTAILFSRQMYGLTFDSPDRLPGCHAVQLLIVFLSCNAAFSNPDSDLTYVDSDLWFNSRQMLKSWHNLIQWINSYRKWPLIQQRRQMVLNSCKLWQFTYKPLSVLRPVLLTDGTRGLTRKRISELSLCSDQTIYYH